MKSFGLAMMAVMAEAGINFRGCQTPTLIPDFSVYFFQGGWWELARDKDVVFDKGTCVLTSIGQRPTGEISLVKS